jgi:hypothetical protein
MEFFVGHGFTGGGKMFLRPSFRAKRGIPLRSKSKERKEGFLASLGMTVYLLFSATSSAVTLSLNNRTGFSRWPVSLQAVKQALWRLIAY